MYQLPTSVEIGGLIYEIRSDFRVVLDIMTAMNDPELTQQEKAIVLLELFYPDIASMPPEFWQDAVNECILFINGGNEEDRKTKQPKLVCWEQDFQYIVSPINKVIGKEIRAMDYLHWWTFLAAFLEIGDCTFAQIVRIRERKATGKTLDKQDREWYRKNQRLVDIKTVYTDAEKDILEKWGGARNGG